MRGWVGVGVKGLEKKGGTRKAGWRFSRQEFRGGNNAPDKGILT